MAQAFELGQLANLISVDDNNQSISIATTVSLTESAEVGAAVTINSDGLTVVGIVTATNFSGSGSLLSNIPNSSLSNSTVSFGGVELSLGQSDLTPAFDLSDSTNLPFSGITGLNQNVTSFLQNPSSSNLASSLSDETGTGSVVFSNSPNLVSPNIGESQAISINATGIVTASQFVSSSGVNLSGMLSEQVNVVPGKISDIQNINLSSGMVHLYTTTETTTFTPNIRFSSSETLKSKLDVGESVSLTIIIPASSSGYATTVTLDGASEGIYWLGASPPIQGSIGYDVYSFYIVKDSYTPATDITTYLVLANKNNYFQ